MPTRTICGQTVLVNDEGFLMDPSQWTKDIAAELAREEGIADLTAAHWKVIDRNRHAADATHAFAFEFVQYSRPGTADALGESS